MNISTKNWIKQITNYVIAFATIIHFILCIMTFYIGNAKLNTKILFGLMYLQEHEQVILMQKLLLWHIVVSIVIFVYKVLITILIKEQDTLTFELIIVIILMIITYKYQIHYSEDQEERKHFIIRANIVFLLQIFILSTYLSGFEYTSIPFVLALIPTMYFIMSAKRSK